MTASERLRELAAKTDDPLWASEVQQGWLIDVGNALPLIADCIEQQERLIFDNGTRSRQQMWRDSEAALLRLAEHLEGGDE